MASNIAHAWLAEYTKYCETEFAQNNGLYDKLTPEQHQVIKDYFVWRTRTAFNEIYKDAKLTISPKKAKDLVHITGGAKDWIFNGLTDLGSKTGRCTLKHAIRYEYYAYSPSLNKQIVFGSKCATDFFDIAPAMLRAMNKVRDETFEEIRQILFVLYTNKLVPYIESNYKAYMNKHSKSTIFMARLAQKIGVGLVYLNDMVMMGIPLTPYFITMLQVTQKELQVEQKNFAYIQDITDSELKQYALQILVDYKVYKPELEIHRMLAALIRQGEVQKNKETMLKLLRLGLKLTTEGSTVINSVKVLQKVDFSFEKLYFIGTGKLKRAAYLDEINTADGVRIEYVHALQETLWENINACAWCKIGSDVTLKNALPKARGKNYSDTVYMQLVDLEPKILAGMESITTEDIPTLLSQQKAWIQEVKQINNTKKPSDLQEVVAEVAKEDQVMWDYLKANMDTIPNDAIKSMLNRYGGPSALSDKQLKFMQSVYSKMGKPTSKMVEMPKEKPVDNKEINRVVICLDTNGKRCALITANSACRPFEGQKCMAENVSEMVGVFKNLVNSPQIITNTDKAQSLFNTIYKEYTDLAQISNAPFVVENPKVVPLYAYTGTVDVATIKQELGFSETELTKYAKTIFPQEGVIDNFLRDVTAQFLYLRKKVRTS